MKSILLSILAIVIYVGLLFGAIMLFSIDIVLGIIGLVVWIVVSGIFWRKATDAADGLISGLLVKYIFPIIGALLALGMIIYIVSCVILDQPFFG